MGEKNNLNVNKWISEKVSKASNVKELRLKVVKMEQTDA